jgi:tetratricopeptide (TPR) repeat protein
VTPAMVSREKAGAAMLNWQAEWGSPTGHDLDLRATFALSWEQVTDEAARLVFLVVGYCAPNQPIPCQALERAAKLERDGCDDALRLLSGLGLLEWAAQETGPMMHPLLAEYAQAEGMTSERRLQVAEALVRLGDAFQELTDIQRPLHLEQAIAAYQAALEVYTREELPLDWAMTQNNLGIALRNRMRGERAANLEGAIAAFQAALEVFRERLPPGHWYIGVVEGNLEQIEQEMGGG